MAAENEVSLGAVIPPVLDNNLIMYLLLGLYLIMNYISA